MIVGVREERVSIEVQMYATPFPPLGTISLPQLLSSAGLVSSSEIALSLTAVLANIRNAIGNGNKSKFLGETRVVFLVI